MIHLHSNDLHHFTNIVHHHQNLTNLKHFVNLTAEFQITIVTLIGVEGSGHHLFEQFIIQMLKQSSMMTNSTEKILRGSHYKRLCDEITSKDIDDIIYCTYEYLAKSIMSNFSTKTLLFFIAEQYSYPCNGQQPINFIPGLTKFVENVNNDPSEFIHINLRFIVLKRNYINTLVSSCIHRFGECSKRVQLQYQGFNIIDQDLKAIDQKYWIMIDYFDICQQPNQYIDIFAIWLNIKDKELIKYGLSFINNPKKNKTRQDIIKSSWDLIEKWDKGKFIEPDDIRKGRKAYINEDPLSYSLKEHLLTDDNLNNLNNSIWFNQCVVVYPENIKFINSSCNLQ